ncbi:MAG: HAD hydrolase-like protein [Bacilli bacterium]
MNNSFYQAFVFDMDGTIVSSIDDIAASVNYSLELHHLPTRTVAEYVTFIGNGSVKLIERALGKDHLDCFQSVFDDYYDYYQNHYADLTHPFKGLIEALDYAKEKQVLLFIYTNKPEKIALALTEKCFGKGYFAKMVGIPLGGKVKPDPKAFLEATSSYHLDMNKVAYFGDSGTDILTATNLGIKNIYSVSWGYKTKAFLQSFTPQPKAILDNPLDIKKVVDNQI